MKITKPSLLRRCMSVAVGGILVAALAACTGRGGGYLPPGASLGTDVLPQALFGGTLFTAHAPFGFDFSCQDAGGINPPTGKLDIQLDYADLGTSVLLDAPFSIHGVVDTIEPGDEWIESAICIGQNPPPGDNELVFLGRFRPTSPPPQGFPTTCPAHATKTSPLCRFEVIVRDNDGNLVPSKGDLFSIKLSSATAVTSELNPADVFYARAGFLEGGNVTVK